MTPADAKPIEQRIREKSRWLSDGCLKWIGTRTAHGYGKMFIGSRSDGTRRNAQVHRLVWELFRGPIPNGRVVAHRCDNPSCVNVEHLFLTTQTDNMKDRDQKQRQARGVKQGLSKLDERKVRKIRELREQGLRIQEIADRFGITDANVSQICKRRTWKHVA